MMDASVDELMRETRAMLCVECGKCASACPMTEIFEDFSYEVSPRGIVEKALLGFDLLTDVGIWFCLTCDVCTALCPAGVAFRDFVQGVRSLAIDKGVTEHGLFCERCGNFVVPKHTVEYIEGRMKDENDAGEYLRFCPSCRRYEVGEKLRAMSPGRRIGGRES
jgi:heterodisulfide reductase subunit C